MNSDVPSSGATISDYQCSLVVQNIRKHEPLIGTNEH
ncbi:hypothetical protein Pla52o_57080 [Novipirellula galeiformis]|uniref:Uncharacterized protein n=1 Tax=Novipirellula galeiformis TaxID=2528004 RepID=A0A5C6BIP3_9BACT|nr:hypothetical protein Pla52o_57080 [Novipirellula galeiformis]